ncbi:hypothetical protein H5410_002558 [Solanum commersonii]|uniref:Uncharacterized protein n=1 Tax=Solanum commersonii TaxID=4109 RepID=A0A9J6B297_SOLCO|nr:hypothetical protein H5410_002558 [Solanum commersonii]
MGAKFKNSSSLTISKYIFPSQLFKTENFDLRQEMLRHEKTNKLTLWKEFIDLYGNKLLTHLKELQNFLVKYTHITISPMMKHILLKLTQTIQQYSGLLNRFGTKIHIDPSYPQAIELKPWYSKYTLF